MELPVSRSRYATPALVCGLLVLVPFLGFLTFLPAIVLGILTLRDKKSGRGSGWVGIIFGGSGLIVGAIAVILGVAGTFANAAKSEAGTYALADGKRLMAIIAQADLDATTTGVDFYPADKKLSKSEELFESLVEREYLSAKDLKSFKTHLLQVANVSYLDPANTLVFVTKKGVPGPIVVAIKSGEVRAFETEREASEFAKIPPRKPSFLP